MHKQCLYFLIGRKAYWKKEIVHNKRFFFFRQCFRDYNTYPFILASVMDRVKEINSYILYSEHDMQNVSRVCYSLFLLFFIKFDSKGTFRITKSYSALCICFCLFPRFYVTLTLPSKSAYVGLTEVVSVVVAIL